MKMKMTAGVKLAATVALVALTLLTGCNKKDDSLQKSTQAPQHSTAGTQIQLEKGLENGKWKGVKIGVTDKKESRDIIFTVDLGSTVQLPESNVSIKVDYFVPNFMLNKTKVVSTSNKPENPAALVSIVDKDIKDPKTGKELTLSGYLFSRYRNDSMIHPRYSFVLIEGVPAP